MKSGTLVRVLARPIPEAHWRRAEGERSALGARFSEQCVVMVGEGEWEMYWGGGRESRNRAPDVSGCMSVLREIRGLISQGKSLVVHSHGLRSAYAGCLIKAYSSINDVSVIYEIHGAVAFEALARHRNLVGVARWVPLYVLELIAPLLADGVLLVSDRLVKYYPSLKLCARTAIPRVVDVNWYKRATTRSGDYWEKVPYGLTKFLDRCANREREVMIYLGGTSPWQELGGTLRVMAHSIQSDRMAGVVLSPDKAVVEAQAADYQALDSEWFEVHCVEPDVVPAVLAECGVGLCLRRKSIVNHVASPTKLYEYITANVRVVVGEGLTEGRKVIRKYGGGVVAEEDEWKSQKGVESLLERLRGVQSAKVSETDMQKRFTWEGWSGELTKLYDGVVT